MPLPVESLSPKSTADQIKQAISNSISQCVGEGKEQDVCVAMVYRMVEKATGRNTSTLTNAGMEWNTE